MSVHCNNSLHPIIKFNISATCVFINMVYMQCTYTGIYTGSAVTNFPQVNLILGLKSEFSLSNSSTFPLRIELRTKNFGDCWARNVKESLVVVDEGAPRDMGKNYPDP